MSFCHHRRPVATPSIVPSIPFGRLAVPRRRVFSPGYPCSAAQVMVWFVLSETAMQASRTMRTWNGTNAAWEMTVADDLTPGLEIASNLEYQMRQVDHHSACYDAVPPPPPGTSTARYQTYASRPTHTCRLMAPPGCNQPDCVNPAACIKNSHGLNQILNTAVNVIQHTELGNGKLPPPHFPPSKLLTSRG